MTFITTPIIITLLIDPQVTSMFGTDFPYQNMLHPVERDNDNKRTNQASNVNTSDRREGIRRSEDRSETRDNGEGIAIKQ